MAGKKGRYETSQKGKKGGILILLLLVCILAAVVFIFLRDRQEDEKTGVTQPAEAVTEPVDFEMRAEDHYAPILQKYRRAITEGWTKEQCEIDGISVRFSDARYASTNSSYQLLDLNNDGREELLICSMATVWDLYTLLEDGTPIHLFTDEQDGTVCFIYEGGIIGIELTTKTDAEYAYYCLEGNSLVAEEMIRYTDATKTWTRESGEQAWETISREAANDIMYGYQPMVLMTTGFVDEADVLKQDNEAVELYMLVLEKYKTALAEKWDMQQCSDNDISLIISYFVDESDRISAHMMDLDGNGVNELIITDGMMIYDLYTLKNGSPVHLITGWERNAYRLCLNNVIYNQGSNGAASTVFNYYQILAGELVLVDSVVFDANKDFDNPWFRSSDGETPEDPITEEEANRIMDSYPFISMLGIDLLDMQ